MGTPVGALALKPEVRAFREALPRSGRLALKHKVRARAREIVDEIRARYVRKRAEMDGGPFLRFGYIHSVLIYSIF